MIVDQVGTPTHVVDLAGCVLHINQKVKFTAYILQQ
jgi:dTDP-4-dehydrorhamnose reductase